MYEELREHGLVIITVALDRDVEDPREFIEAAHPTHPSLIDTEHRLAELYDIINVPTVVWIDEEGRIVRPNLVAFGSDMFKEMTGREAAPHLEALRRWARTGELPPDSARERAEQMLPNDDEQLAKTEFALAWHLHQSGAEEAARRHFARAGELSPDDFTVRRAALKIQGIDPMFSDEFIQMYSEWNERGRPYYRKR